MEQRLVHIFLKENIVELELTVPNMYASAKSTDARCGYTLIKVHSPSQGTVWTRVRLLAFVQEKMQPWPKKWLNQGLGKFQGVDE